MLQVEKIFGDYCNGVTLAEDSSATLYAYGVVDRIGRIARRNPDKTWTEIAKLDDASTGIEGVIGQMICRANGAIYLGFSTRMDGDQIGAGIELPGLCAQAPTLEDLYRPDYTSDAQLNGGSIFFVRFNKLKTLALRIFDVLVARGFVRKS